MVLRALSVVSVAACLLALVPAALAQSYPGKPIRLLIGYAPGGVAMEAIARAPADGYTLYYFDSGPLTVAPHLAKVGYNILTSFTHLGHVCGSGSLLVVHPFKSVAEVIEASRREPNKWSYGTSGVGGPHHLSGEYFKSVTGANLLHVPYKGGGPA
jgi:tripartite-type tricarboxylate transporter receptor subunit TctC